MISRLQTTQWACFDNQRHPPDSQRMYLLDVITIPPLSSMIPRYVLVVLRVFIGIFARTVCSCSNSIVGVGGGDTSLNLNIIFAACRSGSLAPPLFRGSFTPYHIYMLLVLVLPRDSRGFSWVLSRLFLLRGGVCLNTGSKTLRRDIWIRWIYGISLLLRWRFALAALRRSYVSIRCSSRGLS